MKFNKNTEQLIQKLKESRNQLADEIQEHQKTKKILQNSEDRFRALTESTLYAIIIVDINEQILLWSQTANRIFGYSEKEILGQNLHIIIPKRLYKDHKNGVIGVISREKVNLYDNSIEMTGIRKNGHEFPLELSLTNWQTEEGIFFSIIIRDITAKNNLQSQLVQAQKLEALGQLATGIAHEINTPTQYVGDNIKFLQEAFEDLIKLFKKYEQLLNSIKNNNMADVKIEELEDIIEAIDMEYLMGEIPETITQCLEGIESISQIVRSMKALSHPGTDEKIAVDINKAIENIITVTRNEWKFVAEVSTNLDSSLPLIFCLPGELNQVILNIIINSVHSIEEVLKDSSEKGSSEKKRKIEISTHFNKGDVEIHISDAGGGIPDNIKDKVFDPFFTTKQVNKGTGQGLAISHNVIVEKHNGSITFESEEGKGTTFKIRLPINDL